jgi:glycine hydroxymethyltransferase
MDKQVIELAARELMRQNGGIELIASENYPSIDVREAAGSVFTCKYAEGYPGARYYGGCEVVDELENLCIERCKALFHVAYANVQPHSGSQANFAAYRALINPGDKVLSLALNDGGHLTHGSSVSFSSKMYNFVHYDLGEDGHLDMDIIAKRLDEENPDLFLAGFSSYPFAIDFKKMRELIDAHNAKTGGHCLFMVDMAHIAGLVATGEHPSPIPYAHVTTTTTHKTLRGPRGGLILSTAEFGKEHKLNRGLFPGIQGGPLEHVIAAKAVCFKEAMQPEFKEYCEQIVKNAKVLADGLMKRGIDIVSGGTDNHLMLVDLTNKGITGKTAQTVLDEVNITANRNTIPFEPLSPFVTSGLRLGTPALTTRGFKEADLQEVGKIITLVLSDAENEEKKAEARERVAALCKKYPLYAEM